MNNRILEEKFWAIVGVSDEQRMEAKCVNADKVTLYSFEPEAGKISRERVHIEPVEFRIGSEVSHLGHFGVSEEGIVVYNLNPPSYYDDDDDDDDDDDELEGL